jgi:hypothetical protein
MFKEDVGALLISFRTLRIQKDSLIQCIIAARQQETRQQETRQKETRQQVTRQQVTRQQVTRQQETRHPSVSGATSSRTTGVPNTTTTTATLFNIGDRVGITNRVNIIGRFFRVGDDISRIIKITAKQVRIQTNNDLQVTRDPKNVEHLTDR